MAGQEGSRNPGITVISCCTMKDYAPWMLWQLSGDIAALVGCRLSPASQEGDFSILSLWCVGSKPEMNHYDCIMNLIAVLYSVKVTAEILSGVFGIGLLLCFNYLKCVEECTIIPLMLFVTNHCWTSELRRKQPYMQIQNTYTMQIIKKNKCTEGSNMYSYHVCERNCITQHNRWVWW